MMALRNTSSYVIFRRNENFWLFQPFRHCLLYSKKRMHQKKSVSFINLETKTKVWNKHAILYAFLEEIEEVSSEAQNLPAVKFRNRQF